MRARARVRVCVCMLSAVARCDGPCAAPQVLLFDAVAVVSVAWAARAAEAKRHGPPADAMARWTLVAFMVLLINLCFFGAGNVASVSSFEIEST